ncbi:hypothetical protein ACFSM5_12140 [Lacibacterium aquatile]|uniref:Uncharacterized protein n=1 Tax=Lacibacterium aquatile TaxID=1168082 RepID=A0ABW5DT07_9PROT
MLTVSTAASSSLPAPLLTANAVQMPRMAPRDSIALSDEAQSDRPGIAAVDSRIEQAEADLNNLQLSVRTAISVGDSETLNLLSLKAGQAMAMLASLGEKFLDEERYDRIGGLLAFGRQLKTMIDYADDPLGRLDTK